MGVEGWDESSASALPRDEEKEAEAEEELATIHNLACIVYLK